MSISNHKRAGIFDHLSRGVLSQLEIADLAKVSASSVSRISCSSHRPWVTAEKRKLIHALLDKSLAVAMVAAMTGVSETTVRRTKGGRYRATPRKKPGPKPSPKPAVDREGCAFLGRQCCGPIQNGLCVYHGAREAKRARGREETR